MDFTLSTYIKLLKTLSRVGYRFALFSDSVPSFADNTIVLRHDVDKKPANSLDFAQIQAGMGIYGTYFFRSVPESFDPRIIEKIFRLGHEIGYHYEDFVVASKMVKGNRKKYSEGQVEREMASIAIIEFEKNLNRLRELAPVTSICMHGSPMSRWDSKLLWKYYDYHDFGLKGEPYFDTNFSEVLYLTDTGRRWDGSSFIIRDKVNQNIRPSPHTHFNRSHYIKFHSTFEIIRAAEEKQFPNKIMMTFHPQRWSDDLISWAIELCAQNIKNMIKYLIVKTNPYRK